jgi:hypothetical protein
MGRIPVTVHIKENKLSFIGNDNNLIELSLSDVKRKDTQLCVGQSFVVGDQFKPWTFTVENNKYFLTHDSYGKRKIWNGFQGLLATTAASAKNGIIHSNIRKEANILEQVLLGNEIPVNCIQYVNETSLSLKSYIGGMMCNYTDNPHWQDIVTDGEIDIRDNPNKQLDCQVQHLGCTQGYYTITITDASYIIKWIRRLDDDGKRGYYIESILIAKGANLELVVEKINEIIN